MRDFQKTMVIRVWMGFINAFVAILKRKVAAKKM